MVARLGFLLPVAIGTLYLYLTERIPVLAFGDPLGPRAFPRLIVCGFALAAVLWLLEIRKAGEPASEGTSGGAQALAVAAAVLAMLAYFLSFAYLGYVVPTTIFLLGLTTWLNDRKWLANIAVSLGFAVVTYFLFTDLLAVPLPRGRYLPL